ncbi:uncharacterized protein LOC132732249 isoform X2 [Ruditapes philippinarum]|uniref:uncharacterized protein LOC132732249 isoform X2 n=1 Tax=Ruditapes philippinarum TaxID=129788 RepID=UPI00295AF0C8|nr:uncharacterized protein LOC132732249 isoform X2 [Ruditapes philippinarum]
MAAYLTSVIAGLFFITFYVEDIVSMSRYCTEQYECYKNCPRIDKEKTSCGFLDLSDCTVYRERFYPCKSTCERQVCCNGYTGENCSTPFGCETATRLPDIDKRGRNYIVKGEDDEYIYDEYLGPAWFSVGQYKMPDSHTVPEYLACGTEAPIYIKGDHPEVTDLTGETVYHAVTCEWYPFNNCSNERNIDIRQCGDETQYYLVRTSHTAAYCMDPPDIQGITDFEAAPTDVTIGDLSVHTELKFKITNGFEIPFLRFNCSENENPPHGRSNRPNLLYSTYWFIESVLIKTFRSEQYVMPLDEEELTDLGYKIGFTIHCGIRTSTSVTGYQTGMKYSESFFAGVKIHPSFINMKKEDTANLTLQPTVPYGCYARVNDDRDIPCKISINLYYPELSDNLCSIGDTDTGSQPKGFLPKDIKNGQKQMSNATLKISSPFFSNSDPTVYKLSLQTQNSGTHVIWKKAPISDFQLFIIQDERYNEETKTHCYAHVDPHQKTSDGKTFENNAFNGSFILYQHESGIQVQMKTIGCNSDRAYCACAVAVRAGGDVFLINICGGLRFIDMTSCKDGGVLIIRETSKVNYQVQTNIGTLIKIEILTDKYRNMMNVDIYMAPKDLNRTKGLCGTFDGDTDNDFHDRNGNPVDEKAFLKAWTLNDEDVNLLLPTCNLNVGTWTADNQALYCSCRCHDTEYDCGAPEEEVICSPSQYVNCTVSYRKTSEYCEYFNKRCYVPLRAKRGDSFFLKQDPEIEMRRLAARSELPHKVIAKREVVENITEEMARDECSNYLHAQAIEEKLQLLGGFNLSQAIWECTWDVYTGQDRGWMETHKQAALSAIETSYKRDANYTISHTDELKEFKTKTCPYDCNGNGACLENGTCSCNSDFFGPTCSNIKSDGPVIEDIEGGGFCDLNYGKDCSCFAVQLEALHEFFFCKRVMIQKTIIGESRVVSTNIVSGWYRNIYNGECCFEDDRRKRSTESETDVLHYKHEISISNDGQNFGPISTLYVFDSLCTEMVQDNVSTASFYLKEGTCIIEGTCYEDQAVDLSNNCFRCRPEITQYNWTEGCIKDNKEEQNHTDTVIGASFGGIVLAIIIIIVGLCIYRHRQRVDAPARYQMAGRPVLNREQLNDNNAL